MKSLHVRHLPEPTLERLKRRAALHHRSLQGELHAILDDAARLPLPHDQANFNLITVKVGSTASWSRNEIYDD